MRLHLRVLPLSVRSTLALAVLGTFQPCLAQRGGQQAGPASTTKLTAAPLDAAAVALEKARIAWEDGDFPTALRGFDALLLGPNAASVLPTIAQVTGTPFEMTELSDDGAPTNNPTLVWSPSGKTFAFEDGVVTRSGRTVFARKSATGITRVREIDGRVLAIAPDDQHALVELTKMSPRLRAARDSMIRLVALTNHSPTTPQSNAIAAQGRIITALVDSSTTLALLNLSDGTSAPMRAAEKQISEARFSGDSRALIIVATTPGDSTGSAIWKGDLTAGNDWQRLTPQGTTAGRILWMSDDATTIVFAAGGGGGGRGGRGGGGGGGGRAGGAGAGALSAYILAKGALTPVSGATPSVSRSGNAIAYVVRSADSARIEIRSIAKPDSVAVAWRSAITPSMNPANPAISPDGRRVAFEMTPREDKEIYLAEPGQALVKVTHDIPHDRSPMWLTNDYLVALQGEPRHTQSFGFDLKTLHRDRLFHNNSIRTIAPEYSVVLAPDGKGMLVAAEGDGNTISPERGVYLLDFDRPATVASVRARIKSQLDEELALRAKSQELFATLKTPVQALVNQISVSRLHDHLDTLTRWGSRYIGQPGNRKALDYISRTLRGYGYDIQVQEFNPSQGSTANIVATLKGTAQPDAVYVISSHMDSVQGGPGADDDGSGSVILLELARVMKDHPQAATIQFAWFTGEEAGLLGSREFVRRVVADKVNVVGALNNDMVGFADDHRMDNTIRYSNAGIRDVQYAASLLFTKLTLYSAKYYKSTDAQSYTDALGEVVGGIGSYPVLNSPHYHQSSDVLEIINYQQLGETAKATMGAIMYMASSPSQLKGLSVTAGTKVSWTKAVENDVLSYQVRYTNKAGVVSTVPSTLTSMTLPSIKAGTMVEVRALNKAGRYSWDWARVLVP